MKRSTPYWFEEIIKMPVIILQYKCWKYLKTATTIYLYLSLEIKCASLFVLGQMPSNYRNVLFLCNIFHSTNEIREGFVVCFIRYCICQYCEHFSYQDFNFPQSFFSYPEVACYIRAFRKCNISEKPSIIVTFKL